ncbi:hypothetical protein HDV00_004786 [Rhizophlyctis rosea]|nr:hypothetical protein HDV00_004786 [Rhizophlyctis rosea]
MGDDSAYEKVSPLHHLRRLTLNEGRLPVHITTEISCGVSSHGLDCCGIIPTLVSTIATYLRAPHLAPRQTASTLQSLTLLRILLCIDPIFALAKPEIETDCKYFLVIAPVREGDSERDEKRILKKKRLVVPREVHDEIVDSVTWVREKVLREY